ncbi:MAG: S8 family serine peptidase [Myxococcaceae bacterium]
MEKLPVGASPEAERLLDLWGRDKFSFDESAFTGIVDHLRSRGYPVPVETLTRPGTDPRPPEASQEDRFRARIIARENARNSAPIDWDNPEVAAALAEEVRAARSMLSFPPSVDGVRAGHVSSANAEFERLVALVGATSRSTPIAVLDNGFAVELPGLKDKVWKNAGEVSGNGVDDDANGFVDDFNGWNTVTGTDEIWPGHHGTPVAAIAGRGTARTPIMPLVVVPGDASTVVPAIEYAASNGARVINMSFAVTDPEGVAAVKAAVSKFPDVLFVVAAGNSPDQLGSEWNLPEQYLASNLLTNLAVVAGGTQGGRPWDGSTWGAPFATHAAQAVDVVTLGMDGAFVPKTGTSFAAPAVASVAAKCLTLDPSLTPTKLKQLLEETSDRHEAWNGLVESAGVVNERRAIQLAALRVLVGSGKAAETAAAEIGLSGEETSQLLESLRRMG